MAVATVVAGAYTNALNTISAGYTKAGFNVKWRTFAEKIGPDGTDIYGKSLLDMVGQGAACSVDAIFKVYSLAGDLYSIWSGITGAAYTAAAPVGQLASSVAYGLVLTAVANTPAAVAGNIATFTAAGAILTPDQDYTLILSSQSRDCPVSFDLLLQDSAGQGSLFVAT